MCKWLLMQFMYMVVCRTELTHYVFVGGELLDI